MRGGVQCNTEYQLEIGYRRGMDMKQGILDSTAYLVGVFRGSHQELEKGG